MDIDKVPSDERIVSLVQCLHKPAQATLLKTKWKDGIDIEEPTLDAQNFAAWLAKPYIEAVARLQRDVYAWENREAAVCPEDVSFEEVIATLRKEVATLQSRVQQLEHDLQQATLLHESCHETRRIVTEHRDALESRVQELTKQLEERSKPVTDEEFLAVKLSPKRDLRDVINDLLAERGRQ